MKGFLILLLLPLAAQGTDFIESVHAQGADIAKDMVVDGSQVVWSPFSVVNVLPLINGDESLKVGFKSAIEYFKELGGIAVDRLTSAFVKDKTKVVALATEYGVDVADFPMEEDMKKVLSEKYKEKFGVEPPSGLLPETLGNTTQIFLTSLLVKGEWEVPFKYSPKARFFLNETHAVKAKYMNNIGFYQYGEIEGVDGKILAIPFKNSSTTFFMIVLPNNSSAFSTLSQQFAEVQVGTIMDKLKKKRTQLTLPKITVDSQLVLQPMPTVKIIQSGSIRFHYYGIDNRVTKLKRTATKFLRSRTNKQDVKFTVNRPFIYMIFDTKSGVLNYGEVLMPQDVSSFRYTYKSEDSGKSAKLTQNAKSLSEMSTELGNNLYGVVKNLFSTFSISPLVISNVLANYVTFGDSKTQELLFSTLNSKAGISELNSFVQYYNSTSKNSTTIYVPETKKDVVAEKVNGLGTNVVYTPEEGVTKAYSEYNYTIELRSFKRYVRSFYRNERDSTNTSFYEFNGHVKYIGLPFWDARAVLLHVSPTQSLLLFIPNERSGVHQIEDGLKDFTVSKFLCQMRDRHVRLRLPDIHIESEVDVLPALKEVYKVDEFSFDKLNLTSFVHKVNFDVVGVKDSSKYRYIRNNYYQKRRPSTRLNFDRPFVFYLLDNIVGTLANGKVTEVSELPTIEIIESPDEKMTVVKTENKEMEEVKVAEVEKTETAPSQPVAPIMK